jgi:hypothetical protein
MNPQKKINGVIVFQRRVSILISPCVSIVKIVVSGVVLAIQDLQEASTVMVNV